MSGTLLTTSEVAERLGLSSAAVVQAIRDGNLHPAARTSGDLLFSEGSVAAYLHRRAEAEAAALAPPPGGTRQDWSAELDRVNGWLAGLTQALPQPPPAPPGRDAVVSPPVQEAPAVAFEPPPAQSAPEAVRPAPPPATSAKPGLELSRQAVLVVQPIVRFRVLRDVADRLATVPGISDVRLEHLEGGVSSYRISFEGERPTGEALGEVLAALNLEVILVDSYR